MSMNSTKLPFLCFYSAWSGSDSRLPNVVRHLPFLRPRYQSPLESDAKIINYEIRYHNNHKDLRGINKNTP